MELWEHGLEISPDDEELEQVLGGEEKKEENKILVGLDEPVDKLVDPYENKRYFSELQLQMQNRIALLQKQVGKAQIKV